FSKVAPTDVIDASKDVPECSKGKVQDVGEIDFSKVAATDVTDAGKGKRCYMKISMTGRVLFIRAPYALVQEVVKKR
nr:hypothetical protein [Tanacetum cinerariifolium]